VGLGLSVLRSVKLVGYFVRFGGELLITRPESREKRAEWLHRFCAAALTGLDVKLTVEGQFPARGALISNHLSYIDIVVFAAMSPCVFCSKAEIEHWPVVGWLATMAGTVYVDRGKGGSAVKAGNGMKAAAEAGLPVVFFPEGTTTNGRTMLPFHSGLLAQALEIDEPMTAAYLRYSLDEDNGPGMSVEDDVCYWGDRSMWPHVFKFLGLRGAHAKVKIADGPIEFSADELHRKVAAVEARDAVLALSGVAVDEGECVQA
jgi:1-acyl-sn-glycerol-3-phosphate acyltransferase